MNQSERVKKENKSTYGGLANGMPRKRDVLPLVAPLKVAPSRCTTGLETAVYVQTRARRMANIMARS